MMLTVLVARVILASALADAPVYDCTLVLANGEYT